MKKLLLVPFLLLSLVAYGSTTHAANLHPPLGEWGFCTTASQIGCIKKATITAPGAAAVIATSAEQVTATGVTLSVMCVLPVNTGLAAANECSSDFPTAGCTDTHIGGGLPKLAVSLSAQTYPIRIELEIATGDYKPRFGMGSGTQKMKISPNGDGTYTYFLDTTIDIIPTANNAPAEVLVPTATAAEYGARYSAWISTAVADGSFIRGDILATATIGHGLCDLNFEGLWFAANSQGFGLTGLGGGPLTCDVNQTQTPCTPNASLVMRLEAGSPHYKQQVPGKELELNPARIVVYLPNKLLAAMGFGDPTTFDARSLSVTTKDGQTTTPTLEPDADGVLVNLGVLHYSQPDPVVTIARRVSSTPAIAVVASNPSILVNRSKSPTNIAALAKVTIPKGAKASLKVQPTSAKYCKLVGTSVKAIAVGTCKVTLTVKSKKGSPTTKVVTLSVNK